VCYDSYSKTFELWKDQAFPPIPEPAEGEEADEEPPAAQDVPTFGGCNFCASNAASLWADCLSCNFDDAGAPKGCTNCAKGKTLFSNSGIPEKFCDWPQIANCDQVDPTTGACLSCASTCYLTNGICKPCGLGKCTECEVAEEAPPRDQYPTCNWCEDGYALTMSYKDGNSMKPQLVCDWANKEDDEDTRRNLHCLVSDLDDKNGCLECDTHHYYNHLESVCSRCSSTIKGCSSCDHTGPECHECEDTFSLQSDGSCKKTECLSHQIKVDLDGGF
jgi:proprotein convertase subtilisin/kexin type 5